MAPQILVTLRSEDRLGEILPYIEEIAQPGMKVVFLLQCQGQGLSASRRNRRALNRLENVGLAGIVDGSEGTAEADGRKESIDEQGLRTEHRVFLTLEALLKRGIEVSVDVYTGSLKKAMKSYTRRGDVNIVMKPLRRAATIFQFLCRNIPMFSGMNRPNFSSIRLLRTNEAV
jgi:hypothetical protein